MATTVLTEKTFFATLKSGKRVTGKFIKVKSKNTSGTENKIFFKNITTNREFIVKNLSCELTDSTTNFLISELNDYFAFLKEQATKFFPDWLQENGKYCFKQKPCYTVKEIRAEYQNMLNLKTKLNIGVEVGLFTRLDRKTTVVDPITSIRILL